MGGDLDVEMKRMDEEEYQKARDYIPTVKLTPEETYLKQKEVLFNDYLRDPDHPENGVSDGKPTTFIRNNSL